MIPTLVFRDNLRLVRARRGGKTKGDFMPEETITASDELAYIEDLIADLDLSPSDRISALLSALEAEVEDEEAVSCDD